MGEATFQKGRDRFAMLTGTDLFPQQILGTRTLVAEARFIQGRTSTQLRKLV